MLDISTFTVDQIAAAHERIIALLDMRILPDPLQDDVYLFSFELARAARERREEAPEDAGIAAFGETEARELLMQRKS